MLTLPSENRFSESLIAEMRNFAASIRLEPTRIKQTKRIYMPRELETCSHVFIKQDSIKSNLTPAYAGPFFVVSRPYKTFRVLKNDRIMRVAINNIKPCFQLKNAAGFLRNCRSLMIQLAAINRLNQFRLIRLLRNESTPLTSQTNLMTLLRLIAHPSHHPQR